MGVALNTGSHSSSMIIIDLLPPGAACLEERFSFCALGEMVKNHSGREFEFLHDRTRIRFPVSSPSLQSILAEAKKAGLDVNFDSFLTSGSIVVSKKWLNSDQIVPFAALEIALQSAKFQYVKSAWNDKVVPVSAGPDELEELLANGGVKITIFCTAVQATNQ